VWASRRGRNHPRIRTQSRIKAELKLYGIELPEPDGKWTKIYLGNLGRIRFNNRFMQESFKCLLEQYHFLDGQIVKQTKLLQKLSKTELYQERVELLMTIPGIGMIAAMELLLELQDVLSIPVLIKYGWDALHA
jgi:transposase